MSELEIPERALTVACDVYDAELIKSTGECAEKRAVRVAAPIIVAAELRRMVTNSTTDLSVGLPRKCSYCETAPMSWTRKGDAVRDRDQPSSLDEVSLDDRFPFRYVALFCDRGCGTEIDADIRADTAEQAYEGLRRHAVSNRWRVTDTEDVCPQCDAMPSSETVL